MVFLCLTKYESSEHTERQETPLHRIHEAEEEGEELAEPGGEFHLSARVVGLLNKVANVQIRGLFKTRQNT